LVVAPGKQADVDVTVSTEALETGSFDKTVWVFVEGQDGPAVTLDMAGDWEPPTISKDPPVERGSAAPEFHLADTGGAYHTLSNYRGRPVVLFFSCGCDWCRKFGVAWSQEQRKQRVSPANEAPLTVVVMSGDADSARQFAKQTGLRPDATVLLTDTTGAVTKMYRADPCPRVFVVDAAGTLRYTNDSAEDAPRFASGSAIAAHTALALRALTAPQQ
jgi:peroxiredoxin